MTPRTYALDVTSVGQRQYEFEVTSVGQRRYEFDVTSVGQRRYIFGGTPLVSVRRHGHVNSVNIEINISSRVQAPFSLCTSYVATNALN